MIIEIINSSLSLTARTNKLEIFPQQSLWASLDVRFRIVPQCMYSHLGLLSIFDNQKDPNLSLTVGTNKLDCFSVTKFLGLVWK